MNSAQRRIAVRFWKRRGMRCFKCERRASSFASGVGQWCPLHEPRYLRNVVDISLPTPRATQARQTEGR